MSHTEKTPPRNWPWIVAVIVGVVVIVVGASVISSMLSNGNAAAPAVSETPAAPASEEPTQKPTNTETAGETDEPDDGTLDDDDLVAIQDAIEAGTPADLYDLLASPVHMRFAASDFDTDRTRDLAVTDLEYIEGSSGWNWNLGDDMLAAFRAGKYADEFPEGAIIGESAESYVISITIDATSITSIFISKSESLVTAPAATP